MKMNKIKFNKGIYSEETVRKTIKVYKDLALITANFQEDYIIVTFWKCKYNQMQTIHEFENYMIGIENS